MTYPHRVAMISMHTSPLATPGLGDAGGLNVFVFEMARRLGERGLKVDVFTRAESENDPEVVEIHEHTRVINIPAGPLRAVAKEELPDLLHRFGEQLDQRMPGYDLVHSHYWLSGLVGVRLAAAHQLPLVHTMHTMARVKNAARGEDQEVEPDDRERGEAEIVAAADALTANTVDEQAELGRHYGARPEQIAIVPPGVDLHTFHPCDQPKSRAQFGVPQDAQVILFVGRIQPLKAPDTLIRAVAELAGRDPGRRQRLRLIIIGSPSGPDGGLVPDAALAGGRARRQRTDRLSATLGADRALPLVLRLRRRRGAVLHRVVRPGGAGGPGLRPAGGRDRCRWAAAHGGRRADRPPGGRSGARPVGRRAGRRARLRAGPGPDGSQRRSPCLDLQLGQHRRRYPAGLRARDRRAPVGGMISRVAANVESRWRKRARRER